MWKCLSNKFRNTRPMLVDTLLLYGGICQLMLHLRFLDGLFFINLTVVVDFFPYILYFLVLRCTLVLLWRRVCSKMIVRIFSY